MPDLAGDERSLTAAERGTATHLALRYIDLAQIRTEQDAREAVNALVLTGRLSQREAGAVNPHGIYALASSELGRRIVGAEKLWREFSFALLRPAEEIFHGGGSDEILLQGVVDCCFVENGRLVVVDYKTDRIPASAAEERAERYRSQLESYAWAMERITGLPVAERLVWFLSPGCRAEL